MTGSQKAVLQIGRNDRRDEGLEVYYISCETILFLWVWNSLFEKVLNADRFSES